MKNDPKPKQYVLPLSAKLRTEDAGGKGANLAALRRAGFNVPDGFVVTTEAYRHQVEQVRRRCGDTPRKELGRELLTEPIGELLDREIKNGWKNSIKERAAVRSSALAEDTGTDSFAGLFHTVLGVSRYEALIQAIREVWRSASDDLGIEYSSGRGKTGGGEMAVVVQEMVEADWAGVAFSQDPTASDEEVLYVECVQGLGERLVAGEEVDARFWLTPTGDIRRSDYLSKTRLPAQPELRDLAVVVKKVEDLFGAPQDVEFAWAEGKLFVLQSRPITTKLCISSGGPPLWILPGRPRAGWTSQQQSFFDLWDEYNAPAVRPLELQLFVGAVWQASLDMLAPDGGAPRLERSLVMVDGVPVGVDPAERQNGTIVVEGVHGRWADLDEAVRCWRSETKLLSRRAGDPALLSDQALLRLVDEVAELYREACVIRLLNMHRWIDGERKAKEDVESLVGVPPAELERLLEAFVGGVPHETHRMLGAMEKLAQREIGNREEERDAMLELFMSEFGHFQFDGKPLYGQREILIRQLDHLRGGRRRSVRSVEESAQNAERSLLKAAHNPEEEDELRRSLAELRGWVELRENSKTEQETPRVLLNRLVDELGQRLVRRGRTAEVEEVWYLDLSRIRKALTTKEPDLKALLERRKALVEWKKSRNWLPIGFQSREYTDQDVLLEGLPGSPGIVERGRVRVVRGPEDFGDVRAGEIVVARSTNPIWTQLFSRTAAIIVENGSRLSHAAIVAREFGIPAVVGVPGVCKALSTGDEIRVSGTDGRIEKLSEERSKS